MQRGACPHHRELDGIRRADALLATLAIYYSAQVHLSLSSARCVSLEVGALYYRAVALRMALQSGPLLSTPSGGRALGERTGLWDVADPGRRANMEKLVVGAVPAGNVGCDIEWETVQAGGQCSPDAAVCFDVLSYRAAGGAGGAGLCGAEMASPVVHPLPRLFAEIGQPCCPSMACLAGSATPPTVGNGVKTQS
jgi:hypothetical protein